MAKRQLKKLDDLKPAKYNPREIKQKAAAGLAKSIESFGDIGGITWNSRTGHLVAGHQRVAQLREHGAELKGGAIVMPNGERFPVRVVDWTLKQEKAANVAANNRHIAGSFTDGLGDVLADLKLSIGDDFGALCLDDLSLDVKTTTEVEQDEVPDVPKKAVTKLGDVWTLGDHLLVCGDCRKIETVRGLMSGEVANVAITSPPYASQRKYDETTSFKPIHPDKYVEWFAAVQAGVADVLASGGSWFVNIKEHCDDGQRSLYVKDLTLAHVREWGWMFVDEFAWSHGGTPKRALRRFKNAWEPIFQFTKDEHKFNPRNVMHQTEGDAFSGSLPESAPNVSKNQGKMSSGYKKAMAASIEARSGGMAYPSNVISAGKNTEALGHDAAYPVKLPSFFMRAFCDDWDNVFDPFLGSGTTLIAAEQLNRKCYGIELSPNYCDVIVERWQNLTGGQATRNGQRQPRRKK